MNELFHRRKQHESKNYFDIAIFAAAAAGSVKYQAVFGWVFV